MQDISCRVESGRVPGFRADWAVFLGSMSRNNSPIGRAAWPGFPVRFQATALRSRLLHQYFVIKVARSCPRFHNLVQACATPRNSKLQKVAASCQFLGNGNSGHYKQHPEGLGMMWKSLITNFRANWRHPAGHSSWPMWSEFESKIARNWR
jgi:hypothetical protein